MRGNNGKINLYFDTNILKKHNGSIWHFEFNETYFVVKSFIVENGYDNFVILVPQIVLDELLQQYIERYEDLTKKITNKVEELQSELNQLEWDITIKKKYNYTRKSEYISYIKEKMNHFIDREKEFLKIIDYPSEGVFSKVIDRSIKKVKPFFGGTARGGKGFKEKKFSDAGFKDVLFLESIISDI